jgi:hypothetical protein
MRLRLLLQRWFALWTLTPDFISAAGIFLCMRCLLQLRAALRYQREPACGVFPFTTGDSTSGHPNTI